MTSSVASPGRSDEFAARGRSGLAVRLASLTPLWALIAFSLTSPTYFRALVMSPPEVLGVDLGIVITAIAMAWMLIGTVLVWNERSRLADLLVLMALTIPATFLVFVTPAVVLVLANLT